MSNSKEHLQKLLGRIGLYERVKASWIYDFYWSIADRQILKDRRKEVEFYLNLLKGFRRGDLIFDVGANYGYKSDIFLRLGARVVAIEPDEMCQIVLKEKFLRYRAKGKPLVVVGRALSDKSSTETMWIDSPGSGKNTFSQKWVETLRSDEVRFGHKLSFGQVKQVETVSVEQLIAEHGTPFFVKVDVEGYELNVLQGLQRPVPYLSFEVNLPEFRAEGLKCVHVLGRLTRDGEFNYTPDCRRGLVLDTWIRSQEFLGVLSSCSEHSIEVFWRTRSECTGSP
jgi:FkbM family methyltransferase